MSTWPQFIKWNAVAMRRPKTSSFLTQAQRRTSNQHLRIRTSEYTCMHHWEIHEHHQNSASEKHRRRPFAIWEIQKVNKYWKAKGKDCSITWGTCSSEWCNSSGLEGGFAGTELTANAWEGPDTMALDTPKVPDTLDMLLPSFNFTSFEGRVIGSLESLTTFLCMFKNALLLWTGAVSSGAWTDLSTPAPVASGMPDDFGGPGCYCKVH